MNGIQLFYNTSNAVPQYSSTRKISQQEKHRVKPGLFITEILRKTGPRIRNSEAGMAGTIEIEKFSPEG